MVACERLCIPFDRNKMVGNGRAFFGLLSVTTLEQWGLDVRDIAKVTFDYLSITSANFEQDPHSHFAVYCTHK